MSETTNYKQHFTQQVLHKYGWGSELVKLSDTRWKITITVAWKDVREFEGEEGADEKDAINLAFKAALDGLKDEIEKQEAKPQGELKDAFPDPMDIYESNRENWDYFWSHKPAEVGIDIEGNQISPPVLAQIATTEYCILEVPKGSISKDLQRLLSDESIVKVFCDNFGHKDKKSLGIDYSKPRKDIVELEIAVAEYLGHTNVARGLTRLVNLTMPELNMLVGKPKRTDKKGRFKNIGRYALIEQGKLPPLKSLISLTYDEQQYAALDAYVTLLVYHKVLHMRENS